MSWKRRVEPAIRPAMRAWWRLTRGVTLGVRGLVEDESGRIILVKHTYLPGWHLPGGGVESGETAAQALERELAEEAGVRLEEPAELFGVYANHRHFRGDHVVLFRARRWSVCETDCAGEIEAAEWFAPHALPADVGKATARRVAEWSGGAPRDDIW